MERATGARRTAVVAGALVAFLVVGSPAFAAWVAAGTGTGTLKARNMPAGTVPTASVSGRNVSAGWSPSAFPDGRAVASYLVKRYDTGGTLQAIESACSGPVGAVTCTEAGVPPGTWSYSVTPLHGNWLGSESSMSSPVTVGSPSLTFSSSTVTSLPATLSGSVANFVTGSSVTFRLDDATTGTVLTGSTNPTQIPQNGSAAVSVTLPAGTSDAAHTVYAIGSDGDVVGAAVTVNTQTSVTLSITNGGPATGTADALDLITVKFPEKLAVASLCSTWSNDNIDQMIAANNVVSVTIGNNAGSSGNDLLTVSTSKAACGAAFRFGTIDLGHAGFVTGTGDAVFKGTSGNASVIFWSAANNELYVRLGARSAGTVAAVNVPTTAVYTSAAGITTSLGVAVSASGSSTQVHF